MTDVTYPDLSLKKVAINIDTLDSKIYTNGLEVEQILTHKKNIITKQKTKKWEI